MVRIITCWALGRFSHWVLEQPRRPTTQHVTKEQVEQQINSVLDAILAACLNHNRKVSAGERWGRCNEAVVAVWGCCL